VVTGAAATPVPLNATVLAVLEPLLVIDTLAAAVPAAVGLNVTLIEQVPLTAILEPHVFVELKDAAFVPVNVTVLTVSAAVPVLVTVILCAALDVFTV
jgi:hypothetical protein